MAGNVYTLHFKLTDGTEVPVEFIVPQGVSVTGAEINDDGHLIITLSDGKTIDAGEVKGGGGTSNLNLINGEAEGSLRGVGATPETDSYKLGKNAVAIGQNSAASGYSAFATGFSSANSRASSALSGAIASAEYSTACGEHAVSHGKNQFVCGRHNIWDLAGKYAFLVGNGNSPGREQDRSNAHTLDWNGNAWFQGDVIVGGKNQDDADAKVLATQEYVNQKVGEIEIPEVPSLDGYATEQYVNDKVGDIKIPEIPIALPNPNALTFSGAVNGSYDGSEPLSVNIPDGVKSWNDLTDKPFGYVVEDGYIVPEKTVAVDMDSGDGLRGFLMTEKLNTPVVGRSYAVKWNGADYNCIAFESDAEGFAGAVLLGNKALVTGEISEEPFILIFGEQDMDGVTVYCTGIALDGSDSVTFSIYGEMEYAKQLDPVFIPEDYINSLIDAKIAAIPSAEEASF